MLNYSFDFTNFSVASLEPLHSIFFNTNYNCYLTSEFIAIHHFLFELILHITVICYCESRSQVSKTCPIINIMINLLVMYYLPHAFYNAPSLVMEPLKLTHTYTLSAPFCSHLCFYVIAIFFYGLNLLILKTVIERRTLHEPFIQSCLTLLYPRLSL